MDIIKQLEDLLKNLKRISWDIQQTLEDDSTNFSETVDIGIELDKILKLTAKTLEPIKAILRQKALDINNQDGWSFYARGRAEYLKKDYTSSISDLSQGIKLSNQDTSYYAEMFFRRAYGYLVQRSYNEAISDYSSYIEMSDPKADTTIDAYRLRGYCFMQVGKKSEAAYDLNYYLATSQADEISKQQVRDWLLYL